jgi:hypothetical protein
MLAHVIAHVPDSPESVGALLFNVGVIGAVAAFYLHDFPLTVESSFLWSAGAVGPALVDLKRRTSASSGIAPMTEEEEDAAVEAYILNLEAEERIRARRIQHIASSSEAPPPHRLH